MATKQERALALRTDWETNPRWKGVTRPYTAEEVINISGSVKVEYTLAKNGAEKLWNRLHSDSWVAGLGALTGNQAIQEVTAGMKAIYLSG
ncbi:MAG: isocitrate lyase, partial [Bacteroidetes bacterium]|nr:isocitrate lyase [Bacteroidota bacterium]